jgi:nitrite reductase/ring-hydroxylating ferredoxin subunit
LGGHLAYAYGVGVDTNAFQAGPQDWTEIGSDADVGEGALKQFRVGQVALLVIRQEGQLYVLADRCSHRGGPLSDGALDGKCVVCPWHSSAFSIIDGSVHRGPATIAQPTYEVRSSVGMIQVRRVEDRSLRQNPV